MFPGRATLDPPEHDTHLLLRLADAGQVDQVVLTRPGKCDVELNCHGGIGVVRWIMEMLRKQGIEEIDWQDWLRRTEPSPLRSEATLALAHAPTLRTASILLDQFHGACEQAIGELLRAFHERRSADALCMLEELVGRIPLARHLTTPWRAVLAGAPNVGKSTLLNALLGFERAISSPVPGTTRDVVRTITAFEGWPVELIDTAGLRDSSHALEAAGVERARRELTDADLVLWVLDASQPPVMPPQELENRLLLVVNKIDLYSTWPLSRLSGTGSASRLSARTGEGMPMLAARIVQALVPIAPPPGAAVPIGDHVQSGLTSALDSLRRGDDEGCRLELARRLSFEQKTCYASGRAPPH
jgi:tRNA modification GTPase